MSSEDRSDAETLLITTLQRIANALERIGETHERLGNHFAPPPPNLVGTPYVANKLGCTTVWVVEMIRRGKLPPQCVVPGTGNGKVWKLYRDRIDKWIASR